MMDLVFIVAIAALGTIAFFFIFQSAPAAVADTKLESLPSQSKKKKPQQKAKEAAPKKKSKKQQPEEVYEVDRDVSVKEEEREIFRQYTAKGDGAAKIGLASAKLETVSTKKKAEKPQMPNQKQITKNLNQGFVVVNKKAPPQLTPEQRKEAIESRERDEQAEKLRQKERDERNKKMKAEREEKLAQSTLSADQIKEALEKAKAERNKTKKVAAQEAGGKVKQYRASPCSDEDGESYPKSWGAAQDEEEDESGTHGHVDDTDYPSLVNV